MKRFFPVAMFALGCFLFWGCSADDNHSDDHQETSKTASGHGEHDHGDHEHGKAGDADLAAAGIINETCPIMEGDEEVDPEVTVDYQGKKVAFCCKKCVPKWNALSDAEKAEKLDR